MSLSSGQSTTDSETASLRSSRSGYHALSDSEHVHRSDPLALEHLPDFKVVEASQARELQDFDEEDGSCWTYVTEAFTCLQHQSDANKQKTVQEALKHTITHNGPTDIDGNIYRYIAFAQFGAIGHADDLPTLFVPPHDCCQCCMMHAGIVMVAALQVLAPLGILATSFDSMRRQFDMHAWHLYDWQQWLVVILAWGFLFLFILSSYFKITQDARSGRKISRLARGLRYLDQPVCNCMLIIDALINAWVAIIVSICMFIVLYQEESALEVLLDALGLAFLQNMDDIASDFGFLGGVWDPNRVGLFYATLAEGGVFRQCGDPDEDDEFLREYRQASWYTGSFGGRRRDVHGSHQDDGRIRRAATLTLEVEETVEETVEVVEQITEDIWTGIPQFILHTARAVLVVLLVLAIPSPFLISSSAASYLSTHPNSELAEVVDV